MNTNNGFTVRARRAGVGLCSKVLIGYPDGRGYTALHGGQSVLKEFMAGCQGPGHSAGICGDDCQEGKDSADVRYAILVQVMRGTMTVAEATNEVGSGRRCESQWGFMESGSDPVRCDPLHGAVEASTDPAEFPCRLSLRLAEALALVEAVDGDPHADLTPVFQATKCLWNRDGRRNPSDNHADRVFLEHMNSMWGYTHLGSTGADGFVSFARRA